MRPLGGNNPPSAYSAERRCAVPRRHLGFARTITFAVTAHQPIGTTHPVQGRHKSRPLPGLAPGDKATSKTPIHTEARISQEARCAGTKKGRPDSRFGRPGRWKAGRVWRTQGLFCTEGRRRPKLCLNCARYCAFLDPAASPRSQSQPRAGIVGSAEPLTAWRGFARQAGVSASKREREKKRELRCKTMLDQTLALSQPAGSQIACMAAEQE